MFDKVFIKTSYLGSTFAVIWFMCAGILFNSVTLSCILAVAMLYVTMCYGYSIYVEFSETSKDTLKN